MLVDRLQFAFSTVYHIQFCSRAQQVLSPLLSLTHTDWRIFKENSASQPSITRIGKYLRKISPSFFRKRDSRLWLGMRYIWGEGRVIFFYRMESLDSNHVTFTRKREAQGRNNSCLQISGKLLCGRWRIFSSYCCKENSRINTHKI